MKHCLIVDDSDVIRKVTRSILERMGCQVSEAETIEAGIEICRSTMPDVILLDWHLGSGNGIELMPALRSLGAPRRPYVLYCTTENDPIDIARAFTCGVDDYLLKPYSRDMIEAKLAEMPARTEAAA